MRKQRKEGALGQAKLCSEKEGKLKGPYGSLAAEL
jgi:hypothetical protein